MLCNTKDDFINNILDLDSDKIAIKDINPGERGYLCGSNMKKELNPMLSLHEIYSQKAGS